ncbi:uncharacterized protein LOC126095684 [Schistocerca cancellata]|uniref:uncharacterized protein LOC126095684 n=1 Tax=Schistocerca cancellata TaxID=274614 RepID=UPI0021195039|nr:uncharacterized protein LOC126095684 [Schistocerca cancellata]
MASSVGRAAATRRAAPWSLAAAPAGSWLRQSGLLNRGTGAPVASGGAALAAQFTAPPTAGSGVLCSTTLLSAVRAVAHFSSLVLLSSVPLSAYKILGPFKSSTRCERELKKIIYEVSASWAAWVRRHVPLRCTEAVTCRLVGSDSRLGPGV